MGDVKGARTDPRPCPPAGIRFRFNEAKAAASAGYFLKLSGGRMPYMKLIKLMYLAERESLREYNRPIVGDTYVAMKRGPVMSRTLNLIKNEFPLEEGVWGRAIERQRYDAVLKAEPDTGPLSAAELRLLDKSWALYSQLDQFALSDLTHQILPEWKDPGESMREIAPEDLLVVLGKSEEEIEGIRQEAAEAAEIARILGG